MVVWCLVFNWWDVLCFERGKIILVVIKWEFLIKMVLLWSKVLGWKMVCNNFFDSLLLMVIFWLRKIWLFRMFWVFIIMRVLIWFWDSFLIVLIILLMVLVLGGLELCCCSNFKNFFWLSSFKNCFSFVWKIIVKVIVVFKINFFSINFNNFKCRRLFISWVIININSFCIIYRIWFLLKIWFSR